MKKIILLLVCCFFMMMFAPMVMASPTITNTYPMSIVPNTIISRGIVFNFSVSVNGATSGDRVFAYVTDGTKYYSTVNISTPANGSYSLLFPNDELPFDMYQLYLVTQFYNDTWVLQDTKTSNFSINGAPKAYTHMMALRNVDPGPYDLQAAHVIKYGERFEMCCHSGSMTIYFFTGYVGIKSGNTGLAAYGSRAVSYAANSTQMINGVSTPVGFKWTSYHSNLLNTSGDKPIWDQRRAYYSFYGLSKVDAPAYLFATCRMNMVDGSAVGGTPREANFSMDNYNYGVQIKIDDAQTKKFYGYYSYYETFPKPGEVLNFGSQTQASWLVGLRIYCSTPAPAGLGMPWMIYMFGFIIVCLFMGSVYSFGRKFNIAIPNFIYMLMGFVGMTAAYVIGFFDLWMYLFMLVLIMLAGVIQFREPIEHAITAVKGAGEGDTEGRTLKGLARRGLKKSYTMGRAAIAKRSKRSEE